MRDHNALIPPKSGWVLERAQAINDLSEITGIGIVAGKYRAFVLAPAH